MSANHPDGCSPTAEEIALSELSGPITSPADAADKLTKTCIALGYDIDRTESTGDEVSDSARAFLGKLRAYLLNEL